MLKRMYAIEYNTWLTLLDLITKKVSLLGVDYGLSGVAIKVVPAYPKDLSKFEKPSIIVQKVSSDQDTFTFGNYIGQHFDESTNAFMDVHSKQHTITFQINIDATSNMQNSLMVALLTEGILNNAIFNYDDSDEIMLMNYVIDSNNPTEMGRMKIDNTFDIMPLQGNSNNDYITTVRFDITVVQSVVLPQELIDISKGFKYNQTIIL